MNKVIAILLTATFMSSFAVAKTHPSSSSSVPGISGLDWGATATTGPYTAAPGLSNVEVDQPNGTTPTTNNSPSSSDLETLQYHHHTRVAVDGMGRIWVAYSGDQTTEGSSGMVTEVKTSTDGTTWSSPLLVVAPASTFDGNQNGGRRISYPRAFVTYNGQLYLVAAIDQPNSSGCCTNEQGEALVAAAMNTNGTIGATFQVSAATYTPISTFPSYTYDSTLGPPIYQLGNLFGTWGGSAPGQPASAWTGYGTGADGTVMVEPSTAQLSANPNVLFRLWRDEGTTQQLHLYQSVSLDYGATWSPAFPTDIPNYPSETTFIKLANSHIAVVGNSQYQSGATDARDPLYLAIFDGSTGLMKNIYSVSGTLTTPTYNNGVTCTPGGRPCGAAYPGAYEYNGTLYISYSTYKQNIWLATVPSTNL